MSEATLGHESTSRSMLVEKAAREPAALRPQRCGQPASPGYLGAGAIDLDGNLGAAVVLNPTM